MAEPTKFEERNSIVGGVGPMREVPVYRDGHTTTACWRLTPAEIQEVIQTGRVYVAVVGHSFPVMSVSGSHPFEKNTQ